MTGLKKTTSMVLALCKLHNFCTEATTNAESASLSSGDDVGGVPAPLAEDHAYAAICSGIELNVTETNALEPTGLLHGGEHFEDVSRNVRRQHQRAVEGNGQTVLPQEKLHAIVTNQGLRRPTPRSW